MQHRGNPLASPLVLGKTRRERSHLEVGSVIGGLSGVKPTFSAETSDAVFNFCTTAEKFGSSWVGSRWVLEGTAKSVVAAVGRRSSCSFRVKPFVVCISGAWTWQHSLDRGEKYCKQRGRDGLRSKGQGRDKGRPWGPS